jgi:hypothetical protein
MEIKLTKQEVSALLTDALRVKCNIVGNVKVDSGVTVEVDFNSLVSATTPKEVITEEPKKEEPKVEEKQEEVKETSITDLFGDK